MSVLLVVPLTLSTPTQSLTPTNLRQLTGLLIHLLLDKR